MKEAAEELLCCSNGKTDKSISGGQTVPFRVGRCMDGVSRWSNVTFMPSIIDKVVCVTFPDPLGMFVERVCLPLETEQCYYGGLSLRLCHYRLCLEVMAAIKCSDVRNAESNSKETDPSDLRWPCSSIKQIFGNDFE